MKDMDGEIPADFRLRGGTEKAPMSTTTSLEVAVRYSASHAPMLMHLRTPNFMSRGANVSYLSAFPAEAECLYPPLTYLAVSDICVTTIRVPKSIGNAKESTSVKVTIIEVAPTIGA
jgi:hypothetical protein